MYFEVSDTGKGIPDECKDMIFEPFAQVEKSDSISGTGLGLPISLQLAQLMEGNLELVDNGGVGATFQLSFESNTIASNVTMLNQASKTR